MVLTAGFCKLVILALEKNLFPFQIRKTGGRSPGAGAALFPVPPRISFFVRGYVDGWQTSDDLKSTSADGLIVHPLPLCLLPYFIQSRLDRLETDATFRNILSSWRLAGFNQVVPG
jgi:hypothetical protein